MQNFLSTRQQRFSMSTITCINYQWISPTGGFLGITEYDLAADREIETARRGHWFFSREQFRRIMHPFGGRLAVLTEQAQWMLDESFLDPSIPETSTHRGLDLRAPDALGFSIYRTDLLTTLARGGSHWMCPEDYVLVAQVFKPDVGILGWVNGGEGTIAFFYNRQEGIKITRGFPLTRDGHKKAVLQLRRSGLPPVGGRATQTMTGPIATALCVASGVREGYPLFHFVPADSAGDG